MMKQSWTRIDVGVAPEYSEELSFALAEEFRTAAEITAGGVRFHIAGEELEPAQRERLQVFLNSFASAWGIPGPMRYSDNTVSDDSWADKWKEFFKPLRIGKRVLICPTWEEVVQRPGDILVRMDPGRAFGTGQHETTRLCLEWLDAWTSMQSDGMERSLLDVGTGSGVLAMAGALLGFGKVTAIDNDPEAIEVARENAELNGIVERISLANVEIGAVEDRFDVVISNIHAVPLIEMASQFVSKVRKGGMVVLSGILIEQMDAVRDAYERLGLELVGSSKANEWCLLEFKSKLAG